MPQDIPDPPSANPGEQERRDRAQTLEWMHEAAQPRRKKRVDPPPDDMEAIRRRAFGEWFEDED